MCIAIFIFNLFLYWFPIFKLLKVKLKKKKLNTFISNKIKNNIIFPFIGMCNKND